VQTGAGTSFSPRRCARFGLSAQSTFAGLTELGFAVVRVSAYWDEIRKDGYAQLDSLLDAARAAQQLLVVTVGMKAIQWPEFYVPPDLDPRPAPDGRLGFDPGFAEDAIRFVTDTVARYRDRAEIVAWQVENEPFNRSGPRGWWIDESLVRREVEAVRALDSRPIALNAFAHFNAALDSGSRPRHGPFKLKRLVPERAILALLKPADILGLDVYTAIGAHELGATVVRRASPDWAASAGRWLRAAEDQGKAAWIMESQAEPWEASPETYAAPLSFAPEDIGSTYDGLAGAGYSTILLWGCEYWFWRAAEGDDRWLEAARSVVRRARAREP
jgi:hypothetical protein